MNIDEFFVALRGQRVEYTGRIWWAGKYGQIRTSGSGTDYCCPLTAVANARGHGPFRVYDWDKAARALGLSVGESEEISIAADGRTRPEYRRRILAALGLSDPPA